MICARCSCDVGCSSAARTSFALALRGSTCRLASSTAAFLSLPVRPVGQVIAQHVEDESLVDGLAHRVGVKRLPVAGLRVLAAEELESLVLGSCGEREIRQVRVLAPRQRRGGQRITVGVTSSLPSRPSARLSASDDLPPDWDECASSMTTAYRLLASPATLSSTNGNFCRVVMMIRAVCPASAAPADRSPRQFAARPRRRARTGRWCPAAASPGPAGR